MDRFLADNQPPGIEIWTVNGNPRCVACGRWCRQSEWKIRHAGDCSTPSLQPVDATPVAAPATSPSRDRFLRAHAKAGDVAFVASEDELVDAVKRGAVSVSDAMNQDF